MNTIFLPFISIFFIISSNANINLQSTWKSVILHDFFRAEQCPIIKDACLKTVPYNNSKKSEKIDSINSTEKVDAPAEKAIESFDEWTKKRRDAVANKANGQIQIAKPDSSSSSKSRRSDEIISPRIAGPTRNFASRECGAKVIAANPESENAKAIVNEKDVDDYMRNPCESAKEKFVVIELCEAIQIKKISIGNFELFASRPKTISVHISERYPPLSNWISLGNFELQDLHKNLQTFEVPQTNIYAKFVRINFEEHYGKEHYCIVSVVNVMGSTLADEYEKEEVAAAMLNVIPENERDSDTSTTPPPSEFGMQTQLPIPPRNVKKNNYTVMSFNQLFDTCNICIPNQKDSFLICYLLPRKIGTKSGLLKSLHFENEIGGNRTISMFYKKRRRNLAAIQKYLKNNEKIVEEEKEIRIENVKMKEVPMRHEPILPAAGATNQREMVLMKLSKRIATVEMNLTLSTEYLSELSKQYVSQMSGYQQELKETRRVSRESAKSLEKLVRDKINGFRRELREIRQSIFVLQQIENNRFNNQANFDMSRQIFMPFCSLSNQPTNRLRQLEDGSKTINELNFEQGLKRLMEQARSVFFGSISWNTDHLISILILSNTLALAILFSTVFYIHRKNAAKCEEIEEKMRNELRKRMSKAGIENRRMIARGLRRAELAVTAAVSSSLKSEKSGSKAIVELENALANLFAAQQARIDEQFEENKNLLRITLEGKRVLLNDTMSIEDSESSSETENSKEDTPTTSDYSISLKISNSS